MKYLMLVCWDAESMNGLTEPKPGDVQDEESPWLDDVQARGIWVTGDQLAPPRRARSVRVRDGKPLITDGPFTETKEAVGGFDILECDSLEAARLPRHILSRRSARSRCARSGELTALPCADASAQATEDGKAAEPVTTCDAPEPAQAVRQAERRVTVSLPSRRGRAGAGRRAPGPDELREDARRAAGARREALGGVRRAPAHAGPGGPPAPG